MDNKQERSSWVAIALFYAVLLIIITTLDVWNNTLSFAYWGIQAGLITLGVGIFAAAGYFRPDLSANSSIFLALTVGPLTIIPPVLMGLGPVQDGFWQQYFSIALGLAAGSFLTFLFLEFSKRIKTKDPSEVKVDQPD